MRPIDVDQWPGAADAPPLNPRRPDQDDERRLEWERSRCLYLHLNPLTGAGLKAG